jgi:uncharacterized protein (DUF924 family)
MVQVSQSEDCAKAVLDFWFKQLTPSDWYKKDDALDATIESVLANSTKL